MAVKPGLRLKLAPDIVDTQSVEWLVFLLIMAAIGAAAAYGFHRRQKRREALAMFAFQNDLEYSRADPFDLTAHPFRLFTLGDGRGCENVVWGPWRGVPVKAADYWYFEESTDSKGRSIKRYRRFSVVIAELEAFVPGVIVERESLADKLAGHLGFRDIEFESERFNRMFGVRSEDREFAYRLIDARMMQWLLASEGRFGFEIAGNAILVYCSPRPPARLIPLLGTARGFRDHIPKMVWAEYGR